VPAPIVIRLSEQIAGASGAEEKAVLQATLGSYLARIGKFDDAERLRLELRRDFGDGRSLRVAVRLMCLEALLLYFRDLSPLSRDRLARAHLLSKASSDRALVALTSSWLAHIDFNQDRFDSMANALLDCMSAVGPDDAEAHCRAAIVLGDALAYIGERKVSKEWYERARHHAVKMGDQASIGAVTYNSAALHVACLRLASLQQQVAGEDLSLAASEVQSAINYQVVAGLGSLDHLLHTARVGVLVLRRQFADVARLGRDVLEREHVPPGSAQELLLKSDIAAALGRCAQDEGALAWIEQVPIAQVNTFEPDDRALMLSSLSDAHACGARNELARDLREAAEVALREHSARVAHLRTILDAVWRRLPDSSANRT
jgi:hypothetical protein